MHGTPVYRRRGSLLPIAYLNQVLGLKSAEQAEAVSIVVLQAEDRQFGLVVDGINDTQEIVVKPLGQAVERADRVCRRHHHGRRPRGPDPRRAGHRPALRGTGGEPRAGARGGRKEGAWGQEQQRLLLFRAGSFERLAVPLSLVARLEEFPRSSIEPRADARWCSTATAFCPWCLCASARIRSCRIGRDADPVQVIVFSDGDRSVGVVVDQILDVAEEAVMVRQKSSRKGLLGSAVVGKRVTDFLDLNEVIHAAHESWFRVRAATGAARPSSSRKLRRSREVSFAAAWTWPDTGFSKPRIADEAIRDLEQQPADVVVAALELPPDGQCRSAGRHASRPEWERSRSWRWLIRPEQIRPPSTGGFRGLPGEVRPRGHARVGGAAGLAREAAETAPVCAGEER